MINKIGNILLIGTIAFGQPVSVLADTMNFNFQFYGARNSNDTSNESFPKDENSLKEIVLKEYNDSEPKGNFADESSRDDINKNQTENDDYFDNKLEEKNILTDYKVESIDQQNDPKSNRDNEVAKSTNIISGEWGTSPWEYDQDTKIMKIFGGRADIIGNSPWRLNTFDVETLIFEEEVVLLPNSAMLFSNFRGSIKGLENLDTSNVTNMSSMFAGTEVTSLDLSNLDTSNVTNMFGMFNNAKVTSLDVSNFDTSNVTNMGMMFINTRLENLDLSSFDTRKVTNMSLMFSVSRVVSLDISNFDTSNVTNMTNMFSSTPQLRQLSLGSKFSFDSSANLSVVPSNANFFGVWQSVGEGTPSNPLGPFEFTSADLMASYDGATMSDTYVWKPNLLGGQIVVYYEDQDQNSLADSVIFDSEPIGTPFTTYEKDIPGYRLIKIPENATGVFMTEEQEVRYVYERSDAAPVTVKYQDSEGNQLAEPTILSGKVGLPYDSEPKAIPGWYVVETPSNASGTFSEEAQEVIYAYERSDAAPVTVKYQDTEGNQLAEPTILSGKVGLPYDSEPKEIPGWYVGETPSNASGIFSDEAQEVVYVYSAKSHSSKSDGNSSNHLPKTGEQIKGQIILSGVGALLVTLVFVAFKQRKKSNR